MEETKKIDFKALSDLVPKGNGAKGKSQSLYQKTMFEGMTSKQCKAQRGKLRRDRDSFIEAAINCAKDKNALANLRQRWAKYAKQVYIDVNNICEANSSEQSQKLCANFLAVMNAKD